MTKRIFSFYQVKRVFLACPGDLAAERSRFPRLVETVNNMRAHSLGFHIEAVGWERVIPSFGRPQDLINHELAIADLAVVVFWNRIGTPSSDSSDRTGTVEEYELARSLFEKLGKPLVWCYFRKPTVEIGDQIDRVNQFRRNIEAERDLLFREYQCVEDFEEMIGLHLVAYLDGLRRWDVDAHAEWMRPDQRLLHGRFLAEGVYTFGTTMRLVADLDGDGHEEEVMFENRHGLFSLYIKKFGDELYLDVPAEFQIVREAGSDFDPKTLHLAIKDVTNDGLPEILVAAHDGHATLKVAVYGFNSVQSRSSRKISKEGFSLLQLLEGGQLRAFVREGGTIDLPYGTAGLQFSCKWNGITFDQFD